MICKLISIIFVVGVCTAEIVNLECDRKRIGADACKIKNVDGDLSNKNVVIDNGGKKVEIIKIKNVHLGRIPSSIITDHEDVSLLELKDCNIFSLNHVDELKKLTKIDFGENNIGEIAEGQLNNPLLEELELFQNEINSIHPNAFKNTPVLKKLDVSNNKLQTIKREVFVDTLETVKLQNNWLESVDGLFNGHPKLMRLYLEGNKLKSIAADTFADCKRIFILDLSKNLIETIDPTAFDTLTYLQSLNLAGNKLKSFHMNIVSDYFSSLDVGNNQLTKLEVVLTVPEVKIKCSLKADSNMLSTLTIPENIAYKKLDLKNNPLLTKIPSAAILRTVAFLYLDNVDLSNADLSSLETNQNLLSISLNHTGISKDTFKMLLEHQRVELIDVSYNPQLSDFDYKQVKDGAPNLKYLELNYCNLESVDVATFKKKFRDLKDLGVGGNKFSWDEAKQIKLAIG